MGVGSSLTLCNVFSPLAQTMDNEFAVHDLEKMIGDVVRVGSESDKDDCNDSYFYHFCASIE